MSVILKALKNSGNEPETVNVPAGEGFFRGKESIVRNVPISKKSTGIINDPIVKGKSNKRVYFLGFLFLVSIAFAVTVKYFKDKNAINPEELKPVDFSATTNQNNPEASDVAAATPTDTNISKSNAEEDALKAYEKGDYDSGIRLFKEAISKNPDDAILHNNLGLAYVKKELYSSAVDEYKKALEMDDKCAECFNNLGFIKSSLGDVFEARKYLEKAIFLSSKYPDPYFNLAVLCEREGDIGNAVKYYKQFSELYPDKNDPLIGKIKNRVKDLTGK